MGIEEEEVVGRAMAERAAGDMGMVPYHCKMHELPYPTWKTQWALVLFWRRRHILQKGYPQIDSAECKRNFERMSLNSRMIAI